jgi:hypothetical protein
MNAKELRIGNLVYHNDEIIEIKSLRPQDDDVNDEISFDSIYGIKLTEEWLIKCGFEECQDYYAGGKSMFFYDIDKSLENSEFYIFSNENNEFNLSSMEDQIVISKKLNIKYVHEIQNLIFALTRKDLVVSDAVY